ncbi:MAG: NADH-quinone oxidoreductase subunit A [Deltaproteobacteria bacterium]|nr:NADH-quinone oxidoreductase subunit A [Deltaproteobacteria bacterium]
MELGFGAVLVFFLITVGFVFAALLIGRLFRPAKESSVKNIPYECGEMPVGQAWFNFNPRFYLIALIFVVFDVEMLFMFPVAAVFKSWVESGRGLVAFVEIAVFVLILFAALVYVWLKGDLRWIKDLGKLR